jgi:hypothetical protein
MQKENNNNKNITFCKRTVSLIERFGTPCDGCEIRSRSLYTDYQANVRQRKSIFLAYDIYQLLDALSFTGTFWPGDET